MMSPIVMAASLPAYILAIATAPHDMKLKAACHNDQLCETNIKAQGAIVLLVIASAAVSAV